MTQLGFDLEDLIREAEAETLPEWVGAPLHYHEDYYDPDDLIDAFEHYVRLHGRLGCSPRSQMWQLSWHQRTGTGHEMFWFKADGRGIDEIPPITGSLMWQAICASCRWHHISGVEEETVHAFHDHAFPGWRELPVVPLRVRNGRDGWVEKHYPPGWGAHGAPVVTERVRPFTRSASGRSPWGGFDIAKEVEEER